MSLVISFLGGLGMFIYGMNTMAEGLENAVGNKMKSLLSVLTKNKLLGVLLGALITAVIQSSSATTVMVVGFVNARIMNLSQAMGVIMGANIGTTVTSWLVSSQEWAKLLTPATLAPIAIFLGVIIMLAGKRMQTKELASVIIGFGILFIGINLMSSAVSPLKESEAFCNIFAVLGKNPILAILAGAFVTAIIQSSSASVGILQSLASAGLVPFSAAVYIIMGQNIGTCATALISGIGANKNAKIASMMHLVFNVIGTLIFMLGAMFYFNVFEPSWASGIISQTQISLIHTAFNIITTILLFPFSNLIIKLSVMIYRGKREEEEKESSRLDSRILETPIIAIESVKSEIVRMGKKTNEAMDLVGNIISSHNKEDSSRIKQIEESVDRLTGNINDFILKLSALKLSKKDHLQLGGMLQVVSDIERVSDQCENISEYIDYVNSRGVSFSVEAKLELAEIFKEARQSYNSSLLSFETGEKAYRESAIESEIQTDRMEIQFRKNNINRLTNNICDSIAMASFQDILVSLERISDHARNIAEESIK